MVVLFGVVIDAEEVRAGAVQIALDESVGIAVHFLFADDVSGRRSRRGCGSAEGPPSAEATTPSRAPGEAG